MKPSVKKDLINAQEDTLVYLLERDDLTVEEVDIFNFVVE